MAIAGNDNVIKELENNVRIFQEKGEISIGLNEFTKEKAKIITCSLNAIMDSGLIKPHCSQINEVAIITHMRCEHNMLKFKFNFIGRYDLRAMTLNIIGVDNLQRSICSNKNITAFYFKTSTDIIWTNYCYLVEKMYNMSLIHVKEIREYALGELSKFQNKKIFFDKEREAFLYIDHENLTVEYCGRDESIYSEIMLNSTVTSSAKRFDNLMKYQPKIQITSEIIPVTNSKVQGDDSDVLQTETNSTVSATNSEIPDTNSTAPDTNPTIEKMLAETHVNMARAT